MKLKYSKEYLEPVILESRNFTDVLRKLGMSIYGNSRNTLRKYIKLYNISIEHFETNEERYKRVNTEIGKMNKIPLNEILVSASTYTNRNNIKNRLFNSGLKKRKCEKCGQDEDWHGEHMSLILDHINGVNNDHRIENLRILCPNCNATLPTHCRGNNRKKKYYCNCGNEKSRGSIKCIDCSEKLRRKTKRPPYKQLLKEIKKLGYCGTGKKYGVSDNAIRKWVKHYEN